jgi:hypothetical protein
VTQPPQREDASANANTNAAPAKTTANTDANVPDYQSIRSSGEISPPVTHEQSEKLLQQFMQWQQKPSQ